jgi:hypothetical protein
VVEIGRSAPEQLGERSATIEAADQSGATLELEGSKRVAPKLGSSGRLTKMSRVHSRM